MNMFITIIMKERPILVTAEIIKESSLLNERDITKTGFIQLYII